MFTDCIEITVHPRHFAHCRLCREPMYCIYDGTLRPYCWDCTCDLQDTEDTRA